VNLVELCAHLRDRRRMYLLDDRFATAVAFVESLHWSYLVASTAVPEIVDTDQRIDLIPSEADPQLTDRMLDLLEEFAATQAP
jgi:hypothetical protein